ncbi:MAG TPA: hypothetical protein VGL51_10280 [Solirubrobacteraceae bacterium]|jgi:hypothetical protein
MEFQPSRLRRGEIVVGSSALVLVVVLFALPWYGLSGDIGRTAATLGLATTVNGWNGLTTLRWLILITVLAGLALTYFQGTRRAPAIPVSLSVIVITLALLTALCLIYRVFISVPGPDSLIEARAGAYVGLAGALALVYGAYRSLREEDRPDLERNAAIPTVELEPRH